METILNWLEGNWDACRKCSIVESFEKYKQSATGKAVTFGDFCAVYFSFVAGRFHPIEKPSS